MASAMSKGGLSYHFDERILVPADGELVLPVRTVALHEGRLLQYCQERGIVCYLPLKKTWRVLRRNYKNRQYQYPTEVLSPMFSGYIFVKANAEQRLELFQTKSVMRMLPVLDQAHLLDELRIVRQIEQIAQDQELDFNGDLKEGDKFLIESGPWQGITGYLRRKDKRFVWSVELDCLGTLVSGTIDPSKYKMTRL